MHVYDNTLTIEFMHWNVESVLDFHERIESMAAAAAEIICRKMGEERKTNNKNNVSSGNKRDIIFY